LTRVQLERSALFFCLRSAIKSWLPLLLSGVVLVSFLYSGKYIERRCRRRVPVRGQRIEFDMAMALWQLFGMWWRYLGVNPNTRAQSDRVGHSLRSTFIALHITILFYSRFQLDSFTRYLAFFPDFFFLSFVLSMTIAVLRALHSIIGSAIDDIERVYASSDHLNSEESTSRHTPEGTPTQTCTPDNETAIPETGQKTPQSNSQAYASPPPSPSMVKTSHSVPALPSSSWTNCAPDFPSLDAPFDPTSLSEALTSHPDVLNAISRIVAAAGHMTATVQTPFLTLCDATMAVSPRMNVFFRN